MCIVIQIILKLILKAFYVFALENGYFFSLLVQEIFVGLNPISLVGRIHLKQIPIQGLRNISFHVCICCMTCASNMSVTISVINLIVLTPCN